MDDKFGERELVVILHTRGLLHAQEKWLARCVQNGAQHAFESPVDNVTTTTDFQIGAIHQHDETFEMLKVADHNITLITLASASNTLSNITVLVYPTLKK